MFTTFVAASPTGVQRGPHESRTSASSPPARPKRAQVARACDYCRLHRVKCDTKQPCSNCQNRGAQCTIKGAAEVRTLPNALREIERLRNRVRELEEQLERKREPSSTSQGSTNATIPGSAKGSPQATSHPICIDELKDHGNRAAWQGIYTSTAKSPQMQWYGPASAMHFTSRISTYLQAMLQSSCPDVRLLPKTASMSFSSPTSEIDDSQHGRTVLADAMRINGDLTATQEDYFLGLFWQSYHCTYQILDEAEFREHYRSLWTASRTTRRPSALVDIVLALCMQLGVSSRPRNGSNNRSRTEVDSTDASIAGRWLYRRSQMLLSKEPESPLLSSLQYQIYAAIYLCNASFQNMAHSALALAIRTAQILGLHLEPPVDMPRAQRELRKRIWWVLYAVEIKTCMKLGRPWSAQLSEVTCTLPADDHELALVSSSNFAAVGGSVTWLSYSAQMIKMLLAVREVYVSYYAERERLLRSSPVSSGPYDNPGLSEPLAEFLGAKMGILEDWARELPDALKTRRKRGVQPYSTAEAPELDIELFAPLWLQRQRLLLELLYHNLAMNLLRPLICFFPRGTSSPTAVDLAVRCVRHAVTITHIVHQALAQTDILTGWHESFQWQWNATLTMLGFIFANPAHATTPQVRRAVDAAVENFDSLGNSLAMATSSAALTRSLAAKGDIMIRHSLPGQHAVLPFTPVEVAENPAAIGLPSIAGGIFSPAPSAGHGSDGFAYEGPSTVLDGELAGYLGLAFNESFNSFFDDFMADDGNGIASGGWNLGQDA